MKQGPWKRVDATGRSSKFFARKILLPSPLVLAFFFFPFFSVNFFSQSPSLFLFHANQFHVESSLLHRVFPSSCPFSFIFFTSQNLSSSVSSRLLSLPPCSQSRLLFSPENLTVWPFNAVSWKVKQIRGESRDKWGLKSRLILVCFS